MNQEKIEFSLNKASDEYELTLKIINHYFIMKLISRERKKESKHVHQIEENWK